MGAKKIVKAKRQPERMPLDNGEEIEFVGGKGVSVKDQKRWVMILQHLTEKLRRAPKPIDFVRFAKKRQGDLGRDCYRILGMDRITPDEAAERYWIARAQYINHAVQVRVVGDPSRGPTRMVVNVRSHGGVRLLPDVMKNDEAKAEVMKEALRELRSYQVKYERMQAWMSTPEIAFALEKIVEAIAALERAAA